MFHDELTRFLLILSDLNSNVPVFFLQKALELHVKTLTLLEIMEKLRLDCSVSLSFHWKPLVDMEAEVDSVQDKVALVVQYSETFK